MSEKTKIYAVLVKPYGVSNANVSRTFFPNQVGLDTFTQQNPDVQIYINDSEDLSIKSYRYFVTFYNILKEQ